MTLNNSYVKLENPLGIFFYFKWIRKKCEMTFMDVKLKN